MVIAGILIGLVVGAAGAWLALRGQYASKLGVLDDARGSARPFEDRRGLRPVARPARATA